MMYAETVFAGAEHPGTKPEVLESSAGFYVGFCDEAGLPYTRETDYFKCEDTAEAALEQINEALDKESNPRWLPYVR